MFSCLSVIPRVSSESPSCPLCMFLSHVHISLRVLSPFSVPSFPALFFIPCLPCQSCASMCSPQSVMALCPSLIRPLHLLSLSGSHVCPPPGPSVKPVSPSLCFRVLPILFWHFLILCSVCSVSLPLSPIHPSCVPHVFPFSLITLMCFYCMSFLLLLVRSSVRCSSCCRFFPYPGSVFHLF